MVIMHWETYNHGTWVAGLLTTSYNAPFKFPPSVGGVDWWFGG